MITVIDHSRAGFPAGLVSHCTRMMGRFYRDKFGLDDSFEAYTATSMAEFAGRFDAARDAFWTVCRDGETVGCAAVDSRTSAGDERTAQFRWFFLAASTRGLGLGRQLLDRAIDFAARAGYARLCLTTHEDLKAAVRLYEGHAFRRVGTAQQDFHGRPLTMTHFARELNVALVPDLVADQTPSCLEAV